MQTLYIFFHRLLNSIKWNYFYSVFPTEGYVSQIIIQKIDKTKPKYINTMYL